MTSSNVSSHDIRKDAAANYDVIIVGAGPAGLTAATYLGRFRRRVLILDGGPSRADWIPESHNTPGFSRGVSGRALLDDMVRQAALYGAERRSARAQTLTRVANGFELHLDTPNDSPLRARFVLLATGVVDRLPELDGIDAAIRAAKVRMCPICDAYEAIDRKIAVLGDGDLGAREAAFLTTYSRPSPSCTLAPPLTSAIAKRWRLMASRSLPSLWPICRSAPTLSPFSPRAALNETSTTFTWR